MLLKEALRSAIDGLTAAKVGSPRMNAEVLLMFVLGCDRSHLYAHSERALTSDEYSRYEEVLQRRASGIPSQYITGHQEFWGMDFIVSPAVLIPRPETEHIVEAVLDLGIKATISDARSGDLSIVDVGTGSGCIALALAKELPCTEIHATDISQAALEIARTNAVRHHLEDRVAFHRTDLLAGLNPDYFDFVVSNPPYVGESEEDQVQLEVRKFEPRNAVFAGPKGTEVIERLIPQAQSVLKLGGWLVMEISGSIASSIVSLLGGWEEVHVNKDLQGIPRVVLARKQRPIRAF